MRQLLLVLSFLVLISCKNTSQDGFSIESFEPESDMKMDEVVLSEVSPAPQTSSQEILKKVIKTANLSYETQDLEKTKQQIAEVINATNGYIQNDNSGKDYNQLYHRITLRVPTENFQQAIDGIAQGVAYFDERTISQKDVTEEFVDLNARLKAKRALEDRYLALLTKAKNVKEMLEIERELSQIREEIEAKEGRLKYLSNQVSESTIYIHFYKITTEVGVTQSYGSKMGNALKSGWNGISVFFLGLLHLWPFLILLGLGGFFVRRWMKKKKK